MNHHATFLTKTIFFATCLALGCTGSGTLGCGSSSSSGGATVDTDLLGIYQVDKYQGSGDGCGPLMDLDGAPRLALFSTPSNTNPKEAILVGQFCGSVENCRAQAKDPPAVVNYAFFEGSDAAGWKGWGIASTDLVGDQCVFEVQVHDLTSSSKGAITIDTRQVETEFMPMVPEGSSEATCRIIDAIDSIDEDSPCKALFLLEATFETTL